MGYKPVKQDRRTKAFFMRLEGRTYREIGARMGDVSREGARKLVFSGAKTIAVSNHPCAQTALEFVRRSYPDFRGDPFELMNKRIRKLVAEKGGIEKLAGITPIEMLKAKHCGRKSLWLITKALRDRGLDWRFDEDSRKWWAESGNARRFPLSQSDKQAEPGD